MTDATRPGVSLHHDAALVVVDVQRGFEDLDYWGPRNNPTADDNIHALLTAWQSSGRPVVIVQHRSVNPASPLHPDGPGYALKDFVAAARPALAVTKTVNSAFYGTPDLHDWLRAAGIRQLVVVGIQTNMCCETTARMAGNLGYDVLFAADATHTFDLAGPDGAVLAADELARATITNLHGGGFARVVSTAALVEGAATLTRA